MGGWGGRAPHRADRLPRCRRSAARQCAGEIYAWLVVELAFQKAPVGGVLWGRPSPMLDGVRDPRGDPMTEAQERGGDAHLVAGPDVSANPATEPHMSELIAVRLSRRTVLVGGMAAVAGFLTRGIGAPPGYAAAAGRDGKATAKAGKLLGFAAIPLGFGDEVAVPAGYTARPFIPWGTPILGSYPGFRPGENTAEEQAQQVGMHHDGMHFFPLARGVKGTRRGLLV